MTQTHTPGPWRVSYERGTTQIRTADNESIMCDETYYPWVPENDADWHLIAAAPDLLSLCELVNDSFGGGRTITFTDADIADLAAAIAKARGVQS